MRKQIERVLLSPLHPFLLAVYFVFRLYATNLHGVSVDEFLRPLLASVLTAGALMGLYRLRLGGWQRAAWMTSATLAAFFLYGLAWSSLIPLRVRVRAEILAGAWILLAVLILTRIAAGTKGRVQPDSIAGMNLVAIILLLFPSLQTIRYAVAAAQPFRADADTAAALRVTPSSPDIYYIILDGYGRSDAVLPYGYDNSAFLASLRGMGFYVADCSQSNYAGTGLSLTSALNLDYIQHLSDAFPPEETDLLDLYKLLEENAVRRSLSNAGYRTVAFASGFHWAEWRDADIFISPPRSSITEFETVILFSTFARLLDDTGAVNLDDLHGENFRKRTRLALDSFDSLADMPGPKFVFLHIIAPHEPSVFDRDGKPVAPDRIDSRDGYAHMAEFISEAILPGLQTLIRASAVPPVILLQGDHGPSPHNPADRMKILNAYFLPQGAERLYPGISPVNSFRVVFNSYFGTGYPLLEDVSYFSNPPARYDFEIMPNTCP